MARKKNPEETVKNILSTALKLFKEKGYEQTNILDIVNTMGVSRGAFYHHFKSKEEVLFALFETKENKAKQLEIYNNPDLTGLEKMQKIVFFEHWDQKNIEEDTLLLNIWIDLLSDPRMLHEHIKDSHATNTCWLTTLVEEAINDGSIKKQDSKTLTELILLLVNIWSIPTIYPSLNLEEYHKKILMIKDILDGLGCPLIDDEIIQLFDQLGKVYVEHHSEI